jgi:cytidylate kinase
MAVKIAGKTYVPGMYTKQRLSAAQLCGHYIREWEEKRLKKKKKKQPGKIYPVICFSRKIGVGALEIADILAEKIGYRTVDREVMEKIAKKAKLSKKTVAFFDESYPGKVEEFLSFFFREKSFVAKDYNRHLLSAVFALDDLGPTIFVGRGTHLILPRERVLAVRFICSKEYRLQRLAAVLEVKKEDVESKLDQIDKEQRDFFKKMYGKKDASPYEFDMVINCDYIKEPQWSAEIVAQAFKEKFATE